MNKRSLVSISNLVDLIVTCNEHPKAANQVFLVSDDNDLSTFDLVKMLFKSFGNKGVMLPVPVWCYHLVGKILGKQDMVNRLVGSLQVDISKTKDLLDWTPVQTVDDAIKETVDAFIAKR